MFANKTIPPDLPEGIFSLQLQKGVITKCFIKILLLKYYFLRHT